MAVSERICPACGRYYDSSHTNCPEDGRALLRVSLTDLPRVGDIIDGRLTVLGVLGTGGMGVVYRALQHSMCREVAVKLLDPAQYEEEDAVPRFLREAREVSRLSHPNVITLFDFGETEDGELYLVMEMLNGRSLADLLADGQPLGLGRAANIVYQICDALSAAHAKEIVHRDLKPENIILVDNAGKSDDFVKVIDFGIAKTPTVDGSSSITRNKMICGTPVCMSPEQIQSRPIDGRTDIYALGCLFFQMLAGTPPFVRRRLIDMLVAHMRDEPPTVSDLRADVPKGVEKLINCALEKEPDRRPQTAAEFKTRLQSLLDAPDFSAPTPLPAGIRTPAPRDPEITNLMAPTSSFVGRTEELAELHGLVESGRRLITLHGPGGMGKTRFSIEYGLSYLDKLFELGFGSVWFCDLTEATTVDGICIDVARVLHVPLVSGGADDNPVTQVSHAIAARGRVLFIIDNFEQVTDLGPETIGRWLQLAPRAQFLVTSRERLALPDEALFELTPLSQTNRADDGLPVASDAVQLFVDRALAARPSFLAEESEKIIAEIVRQLDGLPLAIELAAARMSILTPQQLLDRLRARFDVLARGGRGVPSRQATLRATIDWSWTLLEPWEQAALAQLSVFAGGFTADAAEGVLDLSAFPDAPWVLDVLQALGDKSLIRTTASPEFPGELRLGLYESIREYAAGKLAELEGTAGAEARHRAYFLDTCETWAAGAGRRDGLRLSKLLALERENLVTVFNRAVRAPDDPTAAAFALRAVLVLDPILKTRGPFGQHLPWLLTAVDNAERAGVDAELMVRGYLARGEARRTRKRSDESGRDFDNALRLAREQGNKEIEGRALYGLGNLTHGQGRVEEAVDLFEQAVVVQREAGDLAGEGETLAGLGALSIWLSRLEGAQGYLEGALRCLREDGSRRMEGFVLVALGALHFERGEAAAARMYVEQAVAVLEEASELRYQGEAEMYYTYLDWEAGDLGPARDHIEHALVISREVGDMIYEARYQAILSALDACEGEVGRALEGFNAARDLAGEAGSPLVELTVSLLRGQLDLAMYRQAVVEGDADRAAQLEKKARDRIAPARTPGPPDDANPDGVPPACERCDEVRFVLRMLEKGLAALE